MISLLGQACLESQTIACLLSFGDLAGAKAGIHEKALLSIIIYGLLAKRVRSRWRDIDQVRLFRHLDRISLANKGFIIWIYCD